MDEKKTQVDRIKLKNHQYKELLESTIESVKSQENKLITQLAERLKLSEKFVRTCKF